MRLVTLLEEKVQDGLSLHAQKRTIILSQEDQPGTYSTTAEIARELKIDHRSVSRIIYQDLNGRTLKKQKV